MNKTLQCWITPIFIFLVCLTCTESDAQNLVEGYTFEMGNRGYISGVQYQVKDMATQQILAEGVGDTEGKFLMDLPPVAEVNIIFSREMYKSIEKKLMLNGQKQFLKIEMERSPGYLFEITLADKRDSVDQIVDAVTGAQIEVFNNTTEKLVLELKNHPSQEFQINLLKGNHYTILIRKSGYLAKQMEAYVDVKGCILCFEGINDVRPVVTENLTSGNEYGTLLANVELEKVFSGKSFAIENIYYDLNSAELKKESMVELDKVINLLKYNPNLTLELGSHTDSRGDDTYNLTLSEKRANSAVEYITSKGSIPKFRIVARGYGESYLMNECADGKICTEEDHARNRRTEIKVLGISDDWVFKPLVNIKNEIKMEAEIQGMLNGESNEISEEEFNKLNGKAQSTSTVSNTKNTETGDSSTSKEVIQEMKPQLDSSLDDMPSDAIVDAPSVQAMTDGYRIALKYALTPLNEKDEIFNQSQTIEQYVTQERVIYYLVGQYLSQAAAEKDIAGWKKRFPEAFIIGFKGGRRIL